MDVPVAKSSEKLVVKLDPCAPARNGALERGEHLVGARGLP